MNPAFSVIFLTTLIGAGQGLFLALFAAESSWLGTAPATGAALYVRREDITDIEPRISARYQNFFSATPRYTLVAKHRNERQHDVVIAEDIAGQALMIAVRGLMSTALDIKISQ